MAAETTEPDPLSAAIGARVRAVRRSRHMTQVALSAATGLRQEFISRVEKGRQSLEVLTLARIAVALGVGLDALVAEIELTPSMLRTRNRRPGRKASSSGSEVELSPDER